MIHYNGDRGAKILRENGMKKLAINCTDLEEAFELSDFEANAYLDTETGAVIIIMDETNMELEALITEGDDLETVLSKLRGNETLSDWERQMLIAVAEFEFANDLDRYKMIPRQDSRDGYRDMQEYTWSLEDERLRELLEVAIKGSGAFRRFKDVLLRYPKAQENWFKFRDERLNKRMMDWLAAQDIEPEFK